MGKLPQPMPPRRDATDDPTGAGAPGRELVRCAELDMSWARGSPAHFLRESLQRFLLEPALRYYTKRWLTGRARCAKLESPVVFVANHSSHIDTPIILRALPGRWRRRTVVAAAADYFYRDRRIAALFSLIFNTVPVRRDGGGMEDLAHVERLLDEQWSLLLFPEGTRSREGSVGRLHSGAAVIAAEHGLAMMPIYLSGTRDAMPPGRLWPHRRFWRRRYRILVVFGAPVRPAAGESPRAVMGRVQEFFAAQEVLASAETPAQRRVLTPP
jgi:1-acyl-sn-glycerol-3-phosphate acyltransferase